MSGAKCLVLACGMAASRLHSLAIALVLALIGCGIPVRAPEGISPVYRAPVHISPSTWWQVDSDIVAASQAAVEAAKAYASSSMAGWKDRVHERTESDFIPWFTGYWTQEWLSVKMAWYRANAEEKPDLAVKRLATYLQEQYQRRVLKPVAKEIDPDEVRERASEFYVQSLAQQLQGIQRRYGIPPDQFDRRLKDIPAITLAPPAYNASLHQVSRADPISKLPAYEALLAQVRRNAEGAGTGPLDSQISPVARRAGERMAAHLAASGGAGVASAFFGSVAGMIVSLATAGFGARAHESERPEMERQFRESLNVAVDDLSFGMLENAATGVMAGVYHMAGQIEARLARDLVQPVKLEPGPREMRLLDE